MLFTFLCAASKVAETNGQFTDGRDEPRQPTAATRNGRRPVVYHNSAMNDAYLTAMAALSGSAIGALASLGTTWLNQHSQERAREISESREMRRRLYQEFIEEASRLYVDSLTHDLDGDVSKFVHIYSLISKLRLVSSKNVVRRADDVMRRIVETYQAPSISDLRNIEEDWEKNQLDILRDFSEACREDLRS